MKTLSLWLLAAAVLLTVRSASAQCLAPENGGTPPAFVNLRPSGVVRIRADCELLVNQRSTAIVLAPNTYDVADFHRIAEADQLQSIFLLRSRTDGSITEIRVDNCLDNAIADVHLGDQQNGNSTLTIPSGTMECFGRSRVWLIPGSNSSLTMSNMPTGGQPLANGVPIRINTPHEVWLSPRNRTAIRLSTLTALDQNTELQQQARTPSAWPVFTLQLFNDQLVLRASQSSEARPAARSRQMWWRTSPAQRSPMTPIRSDGTMAIPSDILRAEMVSYYGEAGADLNPTAADVRRLLSRLEYCLTANYAPPGHNATLSGGTDTDSIYCAHLTDGLDQQLASEESPRLLSSTDELDIPAGHSLRVVSTNGTACIRPPSRTTADEILRSFDVPAAFGEIIVGSCRQSDSGSRLVLRRLLLLGRQGFELYDGDHSISPQGIPLVDPGSLRARLHLPPLAWAAQQVRHQQGTTADVPISPVSTMQDPAASRFVVLLSMNEDCPTEPASLVPRSIERGARFYAHLVRRGPGSQTCLATRSLRARPSTRGDWTLLPGRPFSLHARLWGGVLIGISSGLSGVQNGQTSVQLPLAGLELAYRPGPLTITAGLWLAPFATQAWEGDLGFRPGVGGALLINVGSFDHAHYFRDIAGVHLTLGPNSDGAATFLGLHINLFSLVDTLIDRIGE